MYGSFSGLTASMKARVKSLEETPDWLKCCERGTEVLSEHSGVLLDVDPSQTIQRRSHCAFCKIKFEHMQRWLVITSCPEDPEAVGSLISADCIDIDEGS